MLENITSKILSNQSIDELLNDWRKNNQKIVFTNGCFDILHRGHVEYLAKAANLGDKLFIGLNTDSSIKKIKGPGRPIQDESSRAIIMASLEVVSAVMLFSEETPYELIKKVQPDVLVKGADYKPEDIVGFDIVSAKGGSVETIEFVEGHSTTSIISKL
ncbi:MAG: D-glycero-beta-D-manno-heptose 1-phosphate adenylyltransferase [Bacteroidales bacterium]|nr:D-glycero-beta-D-manno-heptose 1-phosphate adenylyltransferase [Bacteroidales bacterium]